MITILQAWLQGWRTVKVTKSDIEEGKRTDVHQCPIARAMNRKFNVKHAFTGAVGTNLRTKGYYRHHPETTAFVTNYDMGRVVKPGHYRIKRVPA